MDHLLNTVKDSEIQRNGWFKSIYKNESDKACLAHNAGYSDINDLGKRTTSDNILKDGAFEIAINSKYSGDQRGLASMVYLFF